MDKETAMKDLKAIVTNMTAQAKMGKQTAEYYDNISRLKRLQDYLESH